ncbi:MAG: carbohydrate ABC transporter permease [Eubacteriales bacterium]|nr:carbohydrate ABC transporter permease [Eubacteriales bacterium]
MTTAAITPKRESAYRRRGKIGIHIVLLLGSIIMIFPFIWMILTSFKTQGEAIMIPPIIFPANWNLSNYSEVMRTLPFDALYVNTLLLIFWRVLCASVFSSMAGFAFAKLEFPLKKLFFAIILTQLMLPSQVFIIPQYMILSSMNMLNTIFALVFPGLVSAFGTFFLRQFYLSLPNDLMEAAKLDGCNVMQTFIKVMAPLTKTAVMALAVFTALFAYSDMMWPLIVNMNIDKMTLAAGISSLQGQHSTKYPIMMAGSALAMIPMLILYIAFQRQFIEGIALTGTKA